jgi:hypothetical protein
LLFVVVAFVDPGAAAKTILAAAPPSYGGTRGNRNKAESL